MLIRRLRCVVAVWRVAAWSWCAQPNDSARTCSGGTPGRPFVPVTQRWCRTATRSGSIQL